MNRTIKTAALAGVAAEALKETPGVTVRLVIGGDGPEGFESYDDVLAAASPDEPTDQAAGAYMFYTSGTTGRPKGVRTSSFVVGMPVSFSAMDPGVRRHAPMLGEHTDEILAEAGYSATQIADLRARRVVT